VTLFEGSGLYGGQVATTNEVDGLPLPGTWSGQDLAIHLLGEARKLGVQLVEANVASLQLGATLALADEAGRAYRPAAVVVASGASLRKLTVPREADFAGRGLSHCATCDGGFFRGQDVVVVGGGDSAAQEALVLAKICRRVIMVCHSPLKAKRAYIETLATRENVDFVWESEVCEILGEGVLSGVRVRHVKSGRTSEVACTGLFPFIGVTPNTAFLPAALRTATGHIQTTAELVTADTRVFAVGAARANYGGHVVQAMAEGVGAAQVATRSL
jgi:thioredoxin reductase (NADPH)